MSVGIARGGGVRLRWAVGAVSLGLALRAGLAPRRSLSTALVPEAGHPQLSASLDQGD